MIARISSGAIAALLLVAAASHAASPSGAGKAVYDSTCVLCHGGGFAGAPRFGVAADWAPRIKAGVPHLYESALKGTPKGMPPKGGKASHSDDDVRAAVDYMVAAAGGAASAAATPAAAQVPKATAVAASTQPPKTAPAVAPTSAPKPAPAVAPAQVPKPVAASAPPAAAATPPSPPASAAAPPAANPIVALAPSATPASTDPNAFNRLLPASARRNLPPSEDGVHDPADPATSSLQPPQLAFKGLPELNAGNRVDWVKALQENAIHPRWDRNDPNAEAMVMDLNIVREVKGSMPDVVYPHKQHTQWLDCSNCHPNIFIPQKGANQISMAAILMGQKCGVCHGKVAFPVSECRLCHSKSKAVAARTTAEKQP